MLWTIIKVSVLNLTMVSQFCVGIIKCVSEPLLYPLRYCYVRLPVFPETLSNWWPETKRYQYSISRHEHDKAFLDSN